MYNVVYNEVDSGPIVPLSRALRATAPNGETKS